MTKYLPEGLIASLGLGQAALLAVADQPPQTILTLAGLTVTLGGGLVWVIKHILSKTIPQMQAEHAANVARLCDTFEDRSKEDREANRENHREIVEAIGRLHCQHIDQEPTHATPSVRSGDGPTAGHPSASCG